MDILPTFKPRYKAKRYALPAFRTDETYHFATPDIAYHFRMAESEYITDQYFHLSDNKIDCFATIMFENLRLGFMHYHIPTDELSFFIKKYPELAQQTSQIHYIYTADAYRRQGLARAMLDLIIQDRAAKGFSYLWLRCEINPKIYYDKGFVPFETALAENCLQFEEFKKDYIQKVGDWDRLNYAFGELRLVKKLNLGETL